MSSKCVDQISNLDEQLKSYLSLVKGTVADSEDYCLIEKAMLDWLSQQYVSTKNLTLSLTSSCITFRLDLFTLSATIANVLAKNSAIDLLQRLDNLFALQDDPPQLICSLNGDEDDFFAAVSSNGSRLYHAQSNSSEFVLGYSSEMLEKLQEDWIAVSDHSGMPKPTGLKWAIQLLQIVRHSADLCWTYAHSKSHYFRNWTQNVQNERNT